MKRSMGTTLSKHLLGEAERFICYPERVRPNRENLKAQEAVDKAIRNLAEWRMTFEPPPSDRVKKFVPQPANAITQVLDD
jgi:hypothetical protein